MSDQFDTRLNNYGLISNQSMLIYHLKLKLAISLKRLVRSPKYRCVGPPKGLNNHYLNNLYHVGNDGVKFNKLHKPAPFLKGTSKYTSSLSTMFTGK